jgi:hypothetical protein
MTSSVSLARLRFVDFQPISSARRALRLNGNDITQLPRQCRLGDYPSPLDRGFTIRRRKYTKVDTATAGERLKPRITADPT